MSAAVPSTMTSSTRTLAPVTSAPLCRLHAVEVTMALRAGVIGDRLARHELLVATPPARHLDESRECGRECNRAGHQVLTCTIHTRTSRAAITTVMIVTP